MRLALTCTVESVAVLVPVAGSCANTAAQDANDAMDTPATLRRHRKDIRFLQCVMVALHDHEPGARCASARKSPMAIATSLALQIHESIFKM